MNNDEQAVLVLSYKMSVKGKLVTVNRLWYPDDDDAKENMTRAIKESSSGFIHARLAKASRLVISQSANPTTETLTVQIKHEY